MPPQQQQQQQHPLRRRTYECLVEGRRGVVVSVVRPMNEVTLRPARLVLGWVTVCGQIYHLGM